MSKKDIFEDLFVLEMTNNHQGNLERGLEIVKEHSRIVRFNNVRAAIKVQFRNLETFIHKNFQLQMNQLKRIENRASGNQKQLHLDIIRLVQRKGGYCFFIQWTLGQMSDRLSLGLALLRS